MLLCVQPGKQSLSTISWRRHLRCNVPASKAMEHHSRLWISESTTPPACTEYIGILPSCGAGSGCICALSSVALSRSSVLVRPTPYMYSSTCTAKAGLEDGLGVSIASNKLVQDDSDCGKVAARHAVSEQHVQPFHGALPHPSPRWEWRPRYSRPRGREGRWAWLACDGMRAVERCRGHRRTPRRSTVRRVRTRSRRRP